MILDVIVSSSQWSATMIGAVDGNGNGLGYSLVGGHQMENIAWNTIDRIHLVFSDNMEASFTSSNVAIVGSHNADYMPQVSLSYDPVANVGTLHFPQPLASDSMILALSGQMLSSSGVALDGEWTDGASSQSGDGIPGGQFNFRIHVHPGDVDNSGTVTFADISAVRAVVGTTVSTHKCKVRHQYRWYYFVRGYSLRRASESARFCHPHFTTDFGGGVGELEADSISSNLRSESRQY